MAAGGRGVAMPQLGARLPAVLCLVGLVERLRQARRGGRFGAVDRAGAVGVQLHVARRLVGCGGRLLREGSAGGGQRQGHGGEQDLVVHRCLHSGSDSAAITTINARPPAGMTNRSEEHTSELQSLMRISYAVFCLKTQKYKLNHIS